MFKCYLEIFDKIGLKVIPVMADPGAIGGDLSHEFHLISESGDTNILYEKKIGEIKKKILETHLDSLLIPINLIAERITSLLEVTAPAITPSASPQATIAIEKCNASDKYSSSCELGQFLVNER